MLNQKSQHPVSVRCLAVPDGTVKRDGKMCLRVSIVLTPVADPKGDFDLDDWPSSAAARLSGLAVAFFDKPDGFRTAPALSAVPGNRDGAPDFVKTATKMWRDIFQTFPTRKGQPVNGFDYLYAICRPPKKGAKTRAGRHPIAFAETRLTFQKSLSGLLRAYKHQDMSARFSGFKAAMGRGPDKPQRPFRDMALLHRLEMSRRVVFPEQRADAIGRLAALAKQKPGKSHAAPPSIASQMEMRSILKNATRDLIRQQQTGENVPAVTVKLLASLRDSSTKTTILADGSLHQGQDLAEKIRHHLVAHDLAHPVERHERYKDRPEFPTEKAFATAGIREGGNDIEDELTDAARRKFAGIRAYPTLAKFLGLIVDVEIPLEAAGFDPGARGYVAAGFRKDDDPLDASRALDFDKTAFSYDSHSDLFVARSAVGTSAAGKYQSDCAINNGVVSLKASRYSVDTIDTTKLLQSLLQQSGAMVEADANGADPGTLSAKFPEAHNRGLTILDELASERILGIQQRMQDADLSKAQEYYAEDLCIGYRVDVRRTPVAGQPRPWATLMGRTVKLSSVWDAFGLSHDQEHPYPDFRERDHGICHFSPKLVPADSGGKVVVASQPMLTWVGDSLAIPADHGAAYQPGCVDQYRDVGMNVEFNLSNRPQDRLPALRFGDSYEFGLRAVMPNGGSLSLSDAERYFDGACTAVTPYRPAADVQAPVVMLTSQDMEGSKPRIALPNELDTRIVLRSDGKTPVAQARRALIPARSSFEQAEQSGLLDDQRGRDLPFGAFRDFARDPKTGAFPLAKRLAAKPGKKPAKAPPPRLTGTVLTVLDQSSGAEPHPYFPEVRGRNVSFAFERNQKTPEGFTTKPAVRAFWSKNITPRTAAPIMIEVRAAPTDHGVPYHGGSFDDAQQGVLPGGYLTQQLVVNIAPGETVSLWYWAWPDTEDFTKGHFYEGFSALQADLGKLAEKFLSGTPFNGTSCYGQIDIVHAVQKPVEAPSFGQLPASIVRLTSNHRWDEAAASLPQCDIGGTVAYFTGTIGFHRPSTVALRCEAAWRDFSDNAVVRIKGAMGETERWAFRPARAVKEMFSNQGIPVEGNRSLNSRGAYDLNHNETGALRAHHYDFADGIARRLTLRLVATSRFTEEFGTQIAPEEYEQQSCPPLTGDPRDAGEQTLWMLSTVRPPEPVVDRIAWQVDEVVTRPGPDNWMVVKKVRPRIYLARPWHASGEDEHLALVFGPPNGLDNVGFTPKSGADPSGFEPYPAKAAQWSKTETDYWLGFAADPMRDSLDAFKADKGLAESVCRWGSDPTTDAMDHNALTPFVSPLLFSGHVARVQNLTMPLSHPPSPDSDSQAWTSDPSETRNVSALLYKPVFDETSGLHYVDFDIDTGMADMPFLRLAMARFQPHASNALWLSVPHIHDAIQPPQPTTVNVRRISETQITVEISSYGYRKRRPGKVDSDQDAPPLMNIRVMRKSTKAGGPVAVFDTHGNLVESCRTFPNADPDPSKPLVWNATFALTVPVSRGRYEVQVDAVELYPSEPDDYGMAPDGSEVEKPAMFSCLVDISDPGHSK